MCNYKCDECQIKEHCEKRRKFEDNLDRALEAGNKKEAHIIVKEWIKNHNIVQGYI